ncbi:DUF2188 domain-containing protein [Micromonospora musae]|uniref:DUF2188 domain-containing protein n=1 Tax=Micromonospora musae TaxID=1894970 RepID=UPI00344714BD
MTDVGDRGHDCATYRDRPAEPGEARASSTHDTKSEAAAAGRDTAVERGTEHVIKKQDGTIGEKNTYPRSRDPRDIEG